MERIRIIPPKKNGWNEAERLEVARLLLKAGFSVRVGGEVVNGKTVYFVEYWRE